MEIRAAVSRGDGLELAFEKLTLEEPRPDEILVRNAVVGICQTDLKAMQGKQGTAKPAVLGHEGVGTVVSVGATVKEFRPGDRVLMAFASCGECGNCHAGRPSYCGDARRLNMNGQRADGSSAYPGSDVHSHFFGQSSFATHSLTAERNAVRLPDELSFEVAGGLGCGIITGAGTVFNVLRVSPGSSVLVFGAGAVGLSAAMAARIAGASRVVVFDIHASRLDLALSVGATHVINAVEEDRLCLLHAICPGGADYAVEASGSPKALADALSMLGTGGVCAIAGAAGDVEATFRWRDLQLKGLIVRGVIEGDANPKVFVPQLVKYYLEGRFPVDRISRLYPFERINDAIADAASGAVVKPLLRISDDV